jgi:outer membrane protein assembly factor BamD
MSIGQRSPEAEMPKWQVVFARALRAIESNMCRNLSILIFFLFAGIWLFPAGCAWFEPAKEKSAYELVVEGTDEFKDRDYRQALELFQELKDRYPFSKYAILAELKIADCYYHRKEYEDAIFRYEEFEKLHPKNEAIPYVVYQIGLCHFDQLDTIDRDQTPAQEALAVFEKLLRYYPECEYAGAARQHIEACITSLAEHDFYVGYFYYKTRHYKAAIERFRRIITEYPDAGVHYKALRYISLCQAQLLS